MAEHVPPELFIDERGRALRTTWHPDDNVVVLSVWHEDKCVATVRLGIEESSRLSTFLIGSWLDGLRRSVDTFPTPP